MSKTAIIFGGSGQTGRYLASICRLHGYQTIQAARSGPNIRVDVSNYVKVREIIEKSKPDLVFQLAGHTTKSHDAVFNNHDALATGTLNILESVRSFHPEARVFVAGSASQFKNTGIAISEDTQFAVESPYALGRIYSTYAARYYRSLNLHVTCGYLFTHESPIRGMSYLSQKIAHSARCIAEGGSERLTIGDPSVEKEWTHAADIANAIYILTSQNEVVEASIGSGEPISIARFANECFSSVGLNWKDHVDINNSFVPEFRRLYSNSTRIRSLGWSPKFTWKCVAESMTKLTEKAPEDKRWTYPI